MSIYEILCILTLPAHVFALFLLCSAFMPEKKHNKTMELISYIGYALGVSIVFLWIRIPAMVLIANITLIFLVSNNYLYALSTRFLNTIFIYIILMIAEIIPLAMVGFFHIKPFENSIFDSIIGIILIRIVTFVLAICVYRFMKRRIREYPIPRSYYVVYIFALLGTLYLFVTSLDAEGLDLPQMIMSTLILLFVNALILYMDEKLYSTMENHAQEKTLYLQIQAYEKQNETMRQSLSAIRSLKHDMKNHLLALSAMYEASSSEGTHSYISRMMQDMEGAAHTLDSGNFVVDSIVNLKLEEMGMLDVNVRFNINIPAKINLSAYDLTIILGNLLDNAMTALAQVQPPHPREFLLHMQYDKGNLIIFIDNTYSHPLNILRGIYKTTKSEGANHGLGIAHVKNVITKYDGILKIEHTDSKFSVSVIIPISE